MKGNPSSLLQFCSNFGWIELFEGFWPLSCMLDTMALQQRGPLREFSYVVTARKNLYFGCYFTDKRITLPFLTVRNFYMVHTVCRSPAVFAAETLQPARYFDTARFKTAASREGSRALYSAALPLSQPGFFSSKRRSQQRPDGCSAAALLPLFKHPTPPAVREVFIFQQQALTTGGDPVHFRKFLLSVDGWSRPRRIQRARRAGAALSPLHQRAQRLRTSHRPGHTAPPAPAAAKVGLLILK